MSGNVYLRLSCQLLTARDRTFGRFSLLYRPMPPVRPSPGVCCNENSTVTHSTPTVAEMTVIPVAGHDSMLLNLSGAHGPFFTRNIVILKDSAGHTGVGEAPGGEKIRQTIEDARPLVVGQPLARQHSVVNSVLRHFADR